MMGGQPQFTSIENPLAALETTLREAAVANVKTFSEINEYVIGSGGKRIRPILMILTSHLGEPDQNRLIKACAAIEMVHTASLLHDDIIDGTTARRGRPTAHILWAPQAVVAAADYFFAKSFVILGEVDNEGRLVSLLSKAVSDLSKGEIMQQQAVSSLLLDMDAYLVRVQHKTASLFEIACRMGALIGGLKQTEIDRLGRYGSNLGIAFQILDDVLDIIGSEETTGKKPGTDIAEGVPTLPIIEAIKESPRLLEIMRVHDKQPELIEEGLKIIKNTKAIAKVKHRGKNMVELAVNELNGFNKEPWVSELHSLAAFVHERYY